MRYGIWHRETEEMKNEIGQRRMGQEKNGSRKYR